MYESGPSNLITFDLTRPRRARSPVPQPLELIAPPQPKHFEGLVVPFPPSCPSDRLFAPREPSPAERLLRAVTPTAVDGLLRLHGQTFLVCNESLPDTAPLWKAVRSASQAPFQIIALTELLAGLKTERVHYLRPGSMVRDSGIIAVEQPSQLILRCQLPTPGNDRAFLEMPTQQLFAVLTGTYDTWTFSTREATFRRRLLEEGGMLQGLLTATTAEAVEQRAQFLDRVVEQCYPGSSYVAYHVRRTAQDLDSDERTLGLVRANLRALPDRPIPSQ